MTARFVFAFFLAIFTGCTRQPNIVAEQCFATAPSSIPNNVAQRSALSDWQTRTHGACTAANVQCKYSILLHLAGEITVTAQRAHLDPTSGKCFFKFGDAPMGLYDPDGRYVREIPDM
jgi:hypothetical protein